MNYALRLYIAWTDFGNDFDEFAMLCECHMDVSSGRDPVLSMASRQFFTHVTLTASFQEERGRDDDSGLCWGCLQF